jgi:hypothetical protein
LSRTSVECNSPLSLMEDMMNLQSCTCGFAATQQGSSVTLTSLVDHNGTYVSLTGDVSGRNASGAFDSIWKGVWNSSFDGTTVKLNIYAGPRRYCFMSFDHALTASPAEIFEAVVLDSSTINVQLTFTTAIVILAIALL